MKEEKEYDFFWGGILSNWYPSEFIVDYVTFNCGEQYMMYMKAMTFNDEQIADKIMRTDNPSEQKKFGRQVHGYDNKIWEEVRFDLVKKGLIEKFRQNEDMKQYLLDRKNKIIVEASPYDRIWGIGYYENDKNILDEIDNWGENLLGKMLMEIAQEL